MVAVDLMFLLGLRLATRECPHSNSQGASAPTTPHIAWSVRVLGSGEAHDARRFPLSPRRDSPMTRHAVCTFVALPSARAAPGLGLPSLLPVLSCLQPLSLASPLSMLLFLL